MDLGKPYSNAQELVHSVAVLSFLEGCPLSIVSPNNVANDLLEMIKSLPAQFDSFCREISGDLDTWTDVFTAATDRLFDVSWCNSQPFVRLLRDYRFWRWFELRCIVVSIVDGKAPQLFNQMQFDPLELSYGISPLSDGRFIVYGPAAHMASGRYLSSARGRIEDFHKTIETYWPSEAGDAVILYVVDRLMTALESRVFATRRLNQSTLVNLSSMTQAVITATSGLHGRIDVMQSAGLVSLISARQSIQNFGIHTLSTDSIDSAIEQFSRHIVERTDEPEGSFSTAVATQLDPQLWPLLTHRQETGALAWTQYFHESITILDQWLSTSTYLSVAPRALSAGGSKIISWDRVCRFLSDVLLASEVTIYRYSLTERGAPLVAVGTYCVGEEGTKRAQQKREFMRGAADSCELRAKSASYRAATTNRAQYVPDKMSPGGMDLIIQPPDTAFGEWGRSVLAIPMRMNGGVWGVLEFVSGAPRHFGDLLRPKCEEAADALAAAFVNVTVYEVVSKLEGYWADEFGSRLGRREELCREISNIFLSDSLSIFTGSRAADHGTYNVKLFGAWPTRGPNSNALPVSTTSVVRSFIDSQLEFQELRVEAQDDERVGASPKRAFLLRLQDSSTSSWVGAVMFSVPYPIAVDSGWRKRLISFAHLVSTIITNLSSDASWGREVKHALRHEYRRINAQVRGVKQRLEQRIFRKLPADDRRVADLLSSDLADIINSIERMSGGLLSENPNSYRFAFLDPRIIAIARARETYDPASQRPVSIREVFNTKFVAAINSAESAGLRVSATGQDYGVMIDRSTIADIIGTLADNAAKYSAPGSEIRMTLAENSSQSLQITISNLAPPLSEDEVGRIFIDGFRGNTARTQFPQKGGGRGLSFAKAAMQIWNAGLRYDADDPSRDLKDSSGRALVWHRFILTFPKSMVVTNYGH